MTKKYQIFSHVWYKNPQKFEDKRLDHTENGKNGKKVQQLQQKQQQDDNQYIII